ncbi:MAG: hypothetical protein CVV42_03655 [Candidatus Riflebacteria bacterium HGW-Riflebacteria-2]|jgi:hypothetical protein|nr:MAG: hypothetical protein CVV42_03655 [Candidatus Riflebacteria bacterium HGW-Riflebacteria-2]
MNNRLQVNLFLLLLLACVLVQPGDVLAQLPPKIDGLPPFPETAQFDIALADIYAELFPDKNMAFVICNLWLTCDGVNPVLLQLGGDIQTMKLSSPDKLNLTYVYIKPYLHLDNLPAGNHQIVVTYEAKHDGITSVGLISAADLRLDAGSYWYPRNVALDSHQVILSLVSSPDYAVNSNAALYKDVPNNLKRMRQFVITQATADGLTLD